MANKYARVTGGADLNCMQLAELLRRRGHEVAMLATASPENEFADGEFVEASVTHVSRDSLGPRRRANVARSAIWNPEAAAAMRRLITRFRPQVVHAHKLYPQLSAAPLVVAARAGVPIVQTLHDYEFMSSSYLDHRGGWIDHDERRASFRALNAATFAIRRWVHSPRVDAWIANSGYVARRYETRGLASTVLAAFVEPIDRPVPGFAERAGAAFVGRLHEEKGVRDVIALAGSLPEIEVRVAGHGPLEGEVAAAARRLENLEFVGKLDRDGVFDLLMRARVCLMPSRWQEPGGIAVLEAMSVGTPVVAFASGGLAEYVGDLGGGRVIEPDRDALARECAALEADRETWELLSARGADGVATRHSPEQYAVAVEGIYGRLVGEAPASP
ncbi:MAG: glycosyltransferase [Solirubrobacterales bacterium]